MEPKMGSKQFTIPTAGNFQKDVGGEEQEKEYGISGTLTITKPKK
jgi:hypothetical protein